MSTVSINIVGEAPGLIAHAWQAARLLTPAQEEERRRIIAVTGSKRSEEEVELLNRADCIRSLWVDHSGQPCIPETVIRAVIEGGARKTKEGGMVRELLLVESVDFAFDRDALGDTPEEWAVTLQHHAGVKVGQSRINRVRALFPEWSASIRIDVADLPNGKPEVDLVQLRRWMDTAGKRIGIGDWRPQKSGIHGRFTVAEMGWS